MIGVFDSGLGGLSVLREITDLLPGHDLLYLADRQFAPYGDRSLDDVRHRSETVARWIVDRGVDAVVVACNTASAASLHHLRDVFEDVPFIGMEPAVKPAAARSRSGAIGVIATDATFQGTLFASLVADHGADVDVVTRACPGLADHVDRGDVDSPQLVALVERHLRPLADSAIDVLVLGCTHYPFLSEVISRVVGPGVDVIDPAPAVARQVERVVGRGSDAGSIELATTGDAEAVTAAAQRLMGWDLGFRQVTIA